MTEQPLIERDKNGEILSISYRGTVIARPGKYAMEVTVTIGDYIIDIIADGYEVDDIYIRPREEP